MSKLVRLNYDLPNLPIHQLEITTEDLFDFVYSRGWQAKERGLKGFVYSKTNLFLTYSDRLQVLSLIETTPKGRESIFEFSFKTGIINVYEGYRFRLFYCWIHKGFKLWTLEKRKPNARIIERQPYKRTWFNR